MIRTAAAGAAVLALVARCAGESSEPAAYTGPDADRVARVAPETPGMEWPAEGTFTTYSPEDALPPREVDDPALAMIVDAHVGCLACPPRLDDVLQEWVDAIDEEARAGG